MHLHSKLRHAQASLQAAVACCSHRTLLHLSAAAFRALMLCCPSALAQHLSNQVCIEAYL